MDPEVLKLSYILKMIERLHFVLPVVWAKRIQDSDRTVALI